VCEWGHLAARRNNSTEIQNRVHSSLVLVSTVVAVFGGYLPNIIMMAVEKNVQTERSACFRQGGVVF